MKLMRNPMYQNNFKIDGHKDLGWQNGWIAKFKEENGKRLFDGYENQPEFQNCRILKHPTREIDNSFYKNRGTDNIVICDICKIFSHYDCSD